MDCIKIIIADDHKLFRDGIKSLLTSEKDFQVIADVSNGEELLQVLKALSPDIIITDISMPLLSGIEATRFIAENYPDIPVLILSMYNSDDFIMDAIRSGAKGYLPKDVSPTELVEAIRAISGGVEFFSSTISQKAFRMFLTQNRVKSGLSSNKLPVLTDREIEIVKLVAEGFLNKEVAEKLNISIRTVDTHKTHIMQKLKLKSTIDMVKYAIRHDLIKI